MTGTAVVRAGTATVRVARAGPGGAVWVAEAAADPAVPLPVLLAGLVDGGGPVVPLGDPAVEVAGDADVVVLDAGRSATAIVRMRHGRVLARRSGPGGLELDGAVAALLVRLRPAWAGHPGLAGEARRVREALSLLPAVDTALPGTEPVRVEAPAVRAVLAGPLDVVVRATRELADGVPVLLVGGVARTPLLAELLDGAGLPDVRVPERPELAALLAAADRYRHGPPATAPALPTAAADGRGTGFPAPEGPTRPAPGPGTGPHRLPSAPATRTRRRVGAALAVAVLVGGLHVTGAAVDRAAAGPGEVPPGLLVQYGYQLRVPDGWAHTGGLPERRRTLLTPAAAPAGSDLIAVESTPLGYDSGAEPGRAAAELRAEYDAAVAAGSPLSGYDPGAEFGGRAVTAYREDGGDTAVLWYVVLDGPAQRSVGCRYTPAGATPVRAACAAVVASLGPA